MINLFYFGVTTAMEYKTNKSVVVEEFHSLVPEIVASHVLLLKNGL